MSIGFNPQYENTARSAEVHVLNEFGKDFYGSQMRVVVLGFVRPEYKYESLEALIDDIREDCWVTGRSLGVVEGSEKRETWQLHGEKWRDEREFLEIKESK